MGDISGVRVSVTGLELDQEVYPDNLLCDFYNGQDWVYSWFMSEQEVGCRYTYDSSFEYVKLVIKDEAVQKEVGEVVLTFSFLNEWEAEDGNVSGFE